MSPAEALGSPQCPHRGDPALPCGQGVWGRPPHSFLCPIPALASSDPSHSLFSGRVSPALLHPGTVTRALSSSPAALTPSRLSCHIPAHGPALFPLSRPAALCRRRLSFGIKHSLPPAFAVLKQATLSFLMYFQLGCAMRITICGSVRQLGCCVSWLCQARLGLAVRS